MSRCPFTKSELAAKRAEAIDTLRERLQPGDRVYTILTHRSSSGMSRRVRVLVGTTDSKGRPKVESIGFYVAHATGRRLDYDTHEVTLTGCGMDVGFGLIYDLGRVLWPEGTPEPHGTRNGIPDREGGYALNHAWL